MMKKFTEIELAEVLRKHDDWGNNKGGEKADLRGAYLRWEDLNGVNLRGADLRGANLSEADLRMADLCGADLVNIFGNNANLSEANLRGADLRGADLSETDLKGADLRGADLRKAKLRWSNLTEANLRGANLQGADLQDVIGNRVEIKSMQIEGYSIIYTHDTLSIGCETHLIEEWMTFGDRQISLMDKDASEWCKKWKDIILKIIEMSPAVPPGV